MSAEAFRAWVSRLWDYVCTYPLFLAGLWGAPMFAMIVAAGAVAAAGGAGALVLAYAFLLLTFSLSLYSADGDPNPQFGPGPFSLRAHSVRVEVST